MAKNKFLKHMLKDLGNVGKRLLGLFVKLLAFASAVMVFVSFIIFEDNMRFIMAGVSLVAIFFLLAVADYLIPPKKKKTIYVKHE